MVRHAISTIGLLLLAAALPAVTPAYAQFDSIFGNGPPRPPADIPPPPQQQPGYYPNGQSYPQQYPQNPDPRDYPDYRANPAPQPPRPVVNRDEPPAQPMPAPMSLPPAARPGGGTIESQPLAPPPGVEPTQQRANTSNPASPTQLTPQQQPGAPQQQPNAPQQQPAATQQANQPPAGQLPAPTDEPPTHEVVMQPPPQRITNPTAVFEGLDKITGRITQFKVAISETVQFGALQVTPKACYSRPPTETPQTDAFVDVDEVTLKGNIKRIFTGWMFKASPGLHAVEHPIYDVWLIDCKGGKSPDVADASDSTGGDRAAAAPMQRVRPAPQRTAPRPPTHGSLPAIR